MSLNVKIVTGWLDGLISERETYYLVLYRRDMREEVTYNHWWQRLLRRPSFTRRIPTDVVDTKAGRMPLTVKSRKPAAITFEDVVFREERPDGSYSSPPLDGCYVGIGVQDKGGRELWRYDYPVAKIVRPRDSFVVTSIGVTISS